MRVLAVCLLLISFSNFASETETEDAKPRVRLVTSLGDIVLQLDRKNAPLSTANFLNYVKDGFYDGTIFHRVISNFMIQGGGFTDTMQKKAVNDPIPNEATNGLKNTRGSIAMARTNDPNSATAQFFINVVNNKTLNHTSTNNPRTWGYAVFGKVVEGMDIVDAIRSVETAGKSGMANVPQIPIVIQSASLETTE